MTKKTRESIVNAQKVADVIKTRVRETKKNSEKKIDLTKIAKNLAERREKVLNGKDNNEKEDVSSEEKSSV